MPPDLPAILTARVSCAALVAAILAVLAGPPAARAQQATPDGDPFLVNGPAVTDGGQEDPDISRTGSGYVIVWESDAEVNEVIWGQRYDDEADRLGDNFPVSVFDESQIDPVVSRADDFVVVWQNTNGNDIWGQRFDAQGAKVEAQFLVNTFTDNEQEHPAIASDDLGDFVVVYESFDFLDLQEGDEIVGQRFSAAGARQDDEFLVNGVIEGDQQDPAVARRPNGSFLVAWESDDGEGLGENSGIFAQRFDPNGDKLDTQFRVNFSPDDNQESPDVGAWEGGYVVVWESDDGEGKGVWARRFDPNGAPIDSVEFLVNTIQDLDQRDPAVSVFDGGEFVVVWQDDDIGSQGQEFDAAGEKLGGQFDVSVSEKIEEKPRVQVREGGFMATWFGAGAEPDNDVFGRNYVVPEPGSGLLGLAALSTLALLARTRRSRS
jgi:hypothetical protein